MGLLGLALRNLTRRPLATALTAGGVAVAIVTFVLLRTVISTWDLAGEVAAKDRIATRHRLSFVVPLPRRYVELVRSLDGVSQTTWINWFGGKSGRHPEVYFASYAVDPPSFLEVFDEVVLSPEQRNAWLSDRQGAIVGSSLARQLGISVGDRLPLESNIHPGPWVVRIAGIYTASRKSFDQGALLLQWDYLNQSVPSGRRDTVGWLTSRIHHAARGAEVAAAIDRRLGMAGPPTRTISERQLNLSFVARFSSLLKALQIMSLIVLVILTLLLANSIAMRARERIREHATLRALGFMPRQIGALIVGESALLGVGAGALGVALGALLINGGMSRFVEENMGSMFPYFRLDPFTVVLALCLSCALGIVAGLAPAFSASRATVAQALGRVE